MSKIDMAAALGIAGASGKSPTPPIGRAVEYAPNQQTAKLSELDKELLDLKDAVTSLETQADDLLDKLVLIISSQKKAVVADAEDSPMDTSSLLTRELRLLTDKVKYVTRALDVNTVLQPSGE